MHEAIHMGNPIVRVFKDKDESSPFIYVYNKLLTSKLDSKNLYRRNNTVMVKNLDNGQVVFLSIKGKTTMKKESATISYDAAVSLGIDMSTTFGNGKDDEPVSVNLLIQQPTILTYSLNAMRSSDRIVKSSAILSAVAISHLIYSILKDGFDLIRFLIEWLTLTL